jgi:FkbM family methyltransferase
MRILSSSQDRKLVRHLTRLRWVLKLARYIRKHRISRFCNRFFYLGNTPTSSLKLIAPYHRGLLMHIDTNSWLERWILNRGFYEPELVEFLERCLRPGMVAIDVGANIGCHTLVMATAVGASGRVFAFEPNPATCDRLRANVCLNRLSNVEIVPLCLSNSNRWQTLFAPLGSEYNQGLASMHRGNLGERCLEITVAPITLDAFVHDHKLDRLDVIKIDVEGHEYQVLTGARRVLEEFRPTLVFEFSERQWATAGVRAEELEEYLQELGYGLFVLRDKFTTGIEHGVSEECNLLAVPRPKKEPSRATESREVISFAFDSALATPAQRG